MANVTITPPPLSSQSMADLLCTIMLLCYGSDENGKAFWAYLRIKPSMAKSFKEAREKGSFNLEDYGSIVQKGFGTEVPHNVREYMEAEYGINHCYEDELLDSIAHVDY